MRSRTGGRFRIVNQPDLQFDKEGVWNMEVRGLGSVGGALPVNRAQPATPPQKSVTGPSSPQDQVEISDVGRMMDEASRTPGIRAQIKAAIESGTYDTPEKLELALGRLIDQVSREEAAVGR
jgi:negative regulator of flagellin synthesis FlgM